MTLCPENLFRRWFCNPGSICGEIILFMKTLTVTETNSPNEINAICVDVINHGMQETPWGVKPRVEFVFETGRKNESGMPEILSRTYNHFPYSRSTLTLEIKNWLGLDISGDDKGWDLNGCVGRHAKLTTCEVVSENGTTYSKIETVDSPGAVHVEPSGTYQRREWN